MRHSAKISTVFLKSFLSSQKTITFYFINFVSEILQAKYKKKTRKMN